jgi:hypothetical protein
MHQGVHLLSVCLGSGKEEEDGIGMQAWDLSQERLVGRRDAFVRGMATNVKMIIPHVVSDVLFQVANRGPCR